MITSISADADGLRDAASRITANDHIALHTGLDAECYHQATSVGRY